jgi:hypothetical protein
MDKKTFWIRFAVYAVFGVVVPCAFLIWRFNLFKEISGISIGGWELVCIIFVAGFFIKTLKSVKKGLPYSYFSQIITGVYKVIIPLCIGLAVIYYLQDVIKQVIQFLCVLIPCELVAIAVNPLPQWQHEHEMDESNATIKNILDTLGLAPKKDSAMKDKYGR